MELKIENVIKSKQKHEIRNIYASSFDKEDRMPFILMLLMSCLWHTDFLAFYEEEILCGLIYKATLFKQTFIMFFAVDENLRSKGYGSKILEIVQSMHPKNKIIVSIEPCDKQLADLDEKVRRKKFYMKNGYEETGFYLKLGSKEQEILIKNGSFVKRSFILFFLFYSNGTVIPKVWKCKD